MLAGLGDTASDTLKIQQAYVQFVGRPANQGEINAWLDHINSGQQTWGDLYNAAINSPEADAYRSSIAKSQAGGALLQVLQPTPSTQVAAANQTTASGDTSNTSQATMSSLTNLLSGSTTIGSYNIPTIALVGGAIAAYFMFSRRR